MSAWEMLALRVLAGSTAILEMHFERMSVGSIEIEALLDIHERVLAIIGAR
ncbi:hypothetical protein [Burkholderia anthina]|uniref:hypothetical protein n=1 Tax=Burkholderia anthina TaxID=179879 RepID=UPI001589CA2A|nr:hypothetical protein [Burkholderia anthina]